MYSVWFEQVEEAFIKRIQSRVKLPDEFGNLTPVSVSIRRPDKEYLIETYPSITIYNLYSSFDPRRNYPFKVNAGWVDAEKTRVLIETSAKPFNLTYQMDFWSKYQSDMGKMLATWIFEHCEPFNLDVKDASGYSRSSLVLPIDNIVKQDYFTNGERIFHSMLTYTVWVELDTGEQVEVPTVQNVMIQDVD